ncbi:hypothetical protein PSPO01_03871 [Paraphaeosphaeria sporulosa]
MLFFIFLFLVSTSAACFPKPTPISPRKDATEAAGHKVRGKMKYYSDGDFDCIAHTMSNRLRRFPIWCNVYGNCRTAFVRTDGATYARKRVQYLKMAFQTIRRTTTMNSEQLREVEMLIVKMLTKKASYRRSPRLVSQ